MVQQLHGAARYVETKRLDGTHLIVQAFCRVYRIGQTSETFFARFVVNMSADSKLDDMQKKKEAVIGQAMDYKSVMAALTVEEIMRLFGKVRMDKNKKPFIHLEDDEKLDRIFKKHGKK